MRKQIDVTAAIINRDNHVFAARRKSGIHLAGYWELPGGKIEPGETPQDCLARELKEELHIVVQIGSFIGESIFDYGDTIVRLLAYQVIHISGDFTLVDHDDSCWLPIHKLATLDWAPADIPIIKQYQSIINTANYYDDNAPAYCNETYSINIEHLYQPFLAQLNSKAHILDLGCGSGRDSKVFLTQGFRVTSVDASEKMAEIATENIGHAVRVLTFQALDYVNTFNGIWAMASLLHCPRETLPDVFRRMSLALKPEGVIFMSFKYGHQDSTDEHDRHFTNFTKSSLIACLKQEPEFSIVKLWHIVSSLRKYDQKWINAIVTKNVH